MFTLEQEKELIKLKEVNIRQQKCFNSVFLNQWCLRWCPVVLVGPPDTVSGQQDQQHNMMQQAMVRSSAQQEELHMYFSHVPKALLSTLSLLLVLLHCIRPPSLVRSGQKLTLTSSHHHAKCTSKVVQQGTSFEKHCLD